MADVSKISVNGTTYNVKDATARTAASNAATAASDAQTTANSKLSDAPSDGSEYVRKDGAWAVASGGGGGDVSNIRYFVSVPVSVATSAEIARITDTSITAKTIVMECQFTDPTKISGRIGWASYAGYIAFTGTCTQAINAYVTLAEKSN